VRGEAQRADQSCAAAVRGAKRDSVIFCAHSGHVRSAVLRRSPSGPRAKCSSLRRHILVAIALECRLASHITPWRPLYLGASAPSGFAASLFNAQSGLAVHVVIVGGLFGFSDFLSIPIVFAPSDICLFLFIRLSRASFDREFSVGRAIRASCPRPTPAAQRRDSGPPSGSRSHTPADPLLRPVARRNG
jgi:hypothetical protein